MPKQGFSAKTSSGRRKAMNKNQQTSSPHFGWFASIIPAMLFLTTISFVPAAEYFWQNYVTKIFPQLMLQSICVLAWMAHVGEGTYALLLSRKLSHPIGTQAFWFAQTFALGYPSLRLLLALKKSREAREPFR